MTTSLSPATNEMRRADSGGPRTQDRRSRFRVRLRQKGPLHAGPLTTLRRRLRRATGRLGQRAASHQFDLGPIVNGVETASQEPAGSLGQGDLAISGNAATRMRSGAR